jgi:hypothetical protein
MCRQEIDELGKVTYYITPIMAFLLLATVNDAFLLMMIVRLRWKRMETTRLATAGHP